MFTVIIAEKEHIDAIKQGNKLFFEPFLENKELAFCQWDPQGQSLSDSVPGLFDVVGRKKRWRAIIINSTNDKTLKMRNPFDVVNYEALANLKMPSLQPTSDPLEPISKMAWDTWEEEWNQYHQEVIQYKEETFRNALTYPLQKLTTWLCYKPENYILYDVQERKDVHDWAMEVIGRDELKPSAKLEMMEREQSKKEIRLKELLRKEFVGEQYLNVAYPNDVYCISLRTTDSNFFDPGAYWNIKTDNDYSKFADRNMYFDKMRFMVFDLLPNHHCSFRSDYIRFLASVLIIATNQIPGSAMQTRRLYQIDSESDDTPLCTLVTSYDRKLASTSQVIDNEMDKIRNEIPTHLTDKDVEEIISSPRDVAMDIHEDYETDKAYAETNYGLFFDYPENELRKWEKDYGVSKYELEHLMKYQSRIIRKSVSQAKISSKILDIDASRIVPRLTTYQVDDIKEYTNMIENEMVESIPPNYSDMSRYDDQLEEENTNIKKVMKRRMSKNTTITLSLVFLGCFLLCFLPFIWSNLDSLDGLSSTMLIGIIAVVVFIVIMLIILFVLRHKLIKALNSYNKKVSEIVEDVTSSLAHFSKYLSASCNVRRGFAIQNFSHSNMDVYTKRLRIRIKHQEDIHKKRAYLAEEYKDYFGDSSYCDKIMATPYDYDFDQKTEYLYPAPFLAGDSRQIEFISSGNYVSVPSSYITSILVRMEGIYE